MISIGVCIGLITALLIPTELKKEWSQLRICFQIRFQIRFQICFQNSFSYSESIQCTFHISSYKYSTSNTHRLTLLLFLNILSLKTLSKSPNVLLSKNKKFLYSSFTVHIS